MATGMKRRKPWRNAYELFFVNTGYVVATYYTLRACKLNLVRFTLGGKLPSKLDYRLIKVRTRISNEHS
jgi:hypothetical protein